MNAAAAMLSEAMKSMRADPSRAVTLYRSGVHRASAEQVRQPISARGLDAWRAFEPHLDPLKAVLGAVLDDYPK